MPDFRDPEFLLEHIRHTLAFYDPRCVDPSGGFFHFYKDDGHIHDRRTRHLVSSTRFVFNHATALRRFGPVERLQQYHHAVVAAVCGAPVYLENPLRIPGAQAQQIWAIRPVQGHASPDGDETRDGFGWHRATTPREGGEQVADAHHLDTAGRLAGPSGRATSSMTWEGAAALVATCGRPIAR